jgi:hypothetical protein
VDSSQVEREVLARLEAVAGPVSETSQSSSPSPTPTQAKAAAARTRIPRKANATSSSPSPVPLPRRRSAEPHPHPIGHMRTIAQTSIRASKAAAKVKGKSRTSRSAIDDDQLDDGQDDRQRIAREERERQIRHGEITPFAGHGQERGFTRMQRPTTKNNNAASSSSSSSSTMPAPAPLRTARTAATIKAAPKSTSSNKTVSKVTKPKKTAAPTPSPAKKARSERQTKSTTNSNSPSNSNSNKTTTPSPPTTPTESKRRSNRRASTTTPTNNRNSPIVVPALVPDGFYLCDRCDQQIADTSAARSEHDDYHVALALSTTSRPTRNRRPAAKAAAIKLEQQQQRDTQEQPSHVHEAWLNEREDGQVDDDSDDMELPDEAAQIPIQLPPLVPDPSAPLPEIVPPSVKTEKSETLTTDTIVPKLEPGLAPISLSSSPSSEHKRGDNEQKRSVSPIPPVTKPKHNGHGTSPKPKRRLRRKKASDDDDDYEDDGEDNMDDSNDDDNGVADIVDDDDAEVDDEPISSSSRGKKGTTTKAPASKRRRKHHPRIDEDHPIRVNTDDADDSVYTARLERAKERGWLRGPGTRKVPLRRINDEHDDGETKQAAEAVSADSTNDDDEDPMDVVFDGGLVVPGRIWDQLFPYQRTSIKWMWELHSQNAGGIIADEMGLGKTVQITAFLASLHHSQPTVRFGPTLIVCPATIMNQWMRELHTWYPEMRVMLLHESGNHNCSHEELVTRVSSFFSFLFIGF